MGLLGSLLKESSKILGEVSEGALKFTGEVIGKVADEFGAYDLADTSRNMGNKLGEVSNIALKTTGNITGTIVDKTVDFTTEIGGGLGGFVAQSCGASEGKIQNAKNIGKIVGGAAGGLIVGDVIGAGVTGVTAAAGVASTGAAISSLHGAAQTSTTLAQIGGGTLASGGGGVAAGQAILNGINMISTSDGAVSAIKKNKEY
jgi:hypothetical protein